MFILHIIFLISKVIGANLEFDYCHVENIPGCQNKSHLMCQVDLNNNISGQEKTIDSILGPLNRHRNYLSQFGFIANLPNFEWNIKFVAMARKITNTNEAFDYCTITSDYKNILLYNYYPKPNIYVLTHEEMRIKFEALTKSSDPETSWVASAYSTQIGCFQSFSKRLVCLINGVTLKNPTQSYVYENESDFKNSVYNNTKCRSTKLPCTDHLICMKHMFSTNISPSPLTFTSAKYILYKLELNNQTAEWDYYLQYIAEGLLTNSLTEKDNCLAHIYPKITTILLTGIQHFREQISNIDIVWKSGTLIRDGIGCATFTTEIDAITYFNLYCVTGYRVKPHFIVEFFDWIEFRRSHYWTIYLLLGLTILNIVACVILLHCIKVYEFNQLLNPS